MRIFSNYNAFAEALCHVPHQTQDRGRFSRFRLGTNAADNRFICKFAEERTNHLLYNEL